MTMEGRRNKRSIGRGSGLNLTPRQLDVLWLMGRGKTIKQIAAALKLSARTVETHRDKLKVRLGCDNGNELLIAACRHVDAICPPPRQD